MAKNYERQIKRVCRLSADKVTDADKAALRVIEKAKEYFAVKDETENKNTSAVFRALFLDPKNDGRTIVAIAADFGLCDRSLLRHKKYVLEVYAAFAKRSKVT